MRDVSRLWSVPAWTGVPTCHMCLGKGWHEQHSRHCGPDGCHWDCPEVVQVNNCRCVEQVEGLNTIRWDVEKIIDDAGEPRYILLEEGVD